MTCETMQKAKGNATPLGKSVMKNGKMTVASCDLIVTEGESKLG